MLHRVGEVLVAHDHMQVEVAPVIGGAGRERAEGAAVPLDEVRATLVAEAR